MRCKPRFSSRRPARPRDGDGPAAVAADQDRLLAEGGQWRVATAPRRFIQLDEIGSSGIRENSEQPARSRNSHEYRYGYDTVSSLALRACLILHRLEDPEPPGNLS